jgi:Ca2+-binding EF-hand superfamily protein
MEAADTDHNTYIDYQEFIAAASDKARLLNSKNLQAAFKIMDRDGSGRISVEEIREVFDTMGTKKDIRLWEAIMSEVDRDGDRMISFQEFE